MATVQLVNVLSAPINYPGIVPTPASPSPQFGLSNAHIQGAAIYSNAANPTGQSQVNIDYFVSAQKFTGTLILTQALSAIISGS